MQRTITLPDLYARKPQTPGVWLLQDSQSRCKRWQKSNLYSLFQTYLVLNVVILEVDLYTVHAAILWAKPMCTILPAGSYGTSGIPLARFTQGSLRNYFFFAKFTVWTFSWPHTKYTYRLTPCPPTLHKNACSMGRGGQGAYGSCFPPSTTKDWALCYPTCSILICHWGTTGRPLYCQF